MPNVSKMNKATWKASALKNPNKVSYYHKRQLVEAGLLEKVNKKRKTPGRPVVRYKVTGKGKSLIALSKNWKRSKK